MAKLDFIGVGAPRSGSTLLASVLRKHPAICMPSGFSKKEMNFFTFRYSCYKNGLEWYLLHFKHCGDKRLAGEISPSYFSDPESPALIAKAFPDIKLIAILRDPVKRAFSSFLIDKRAGRIPSEKSFEVALNENEKYISDSRYDIHLTRYLKYFDREKFYVILLENLVGNSEAELSKLFHFLDVDISPAKEIELEKVNPASLPRFYFVQRNLKKINSLAKSIGLGGFINYIRQLGRIDLILQGLNSRPPEKLSPKIYESLMLQFSEANKNLKGILELNKLPWERD